MLLAISWSLSFIGIPLFVVGAAAGWSEGAIGADGLVVWLLAGRGGGGTLCSALVAGDTLQKPLNLFVFHADKFSMSSTTGSVSSSVFSGTAFL